MGEVRQGKCVAGGLRALLCTFELADGIVRRWLAFVLESEEEGAEGVCHCNRSRLEVLGSSFAACDG